MWLSNHFPKERMSKSWTSWNCKAAFELKDGAPPALPKCNIYAALQQRRIKTGAKHVGQMSLEPCINHLRRLGEKQGMITTLLKKGTVSSKIMTTSRRLPKRDTIFLGRPCSNQDPPGIPELRRTTWLIFVAIIEHRCLSTHGLADTCN